MAVKDKLTMDGRIIRRTSPYHPIVAWSILVLSSYRIYLSISLSPFSHQFPTAATTSSAASAVVMSSEEELYRAEFLPQPSLQQQIQSYPRKPPLLSNLRTFDESKLPYSCGVIFFYHIACTGGSSMNKWLGKEKDNNANVTYWTDWGRHDGVQQRFIKKMNTKVLDLDPHEWRIVHAHGFSFFPNSSEPLLYQWREDVERQGCAFVATTMLRDAVGHTISQSKGMINPNYTLDHFVNHLEPENYNQQGIFNTQIDYMLYNRGPRNKQNATKYEKVRRAIEILVRHFDVVMVSDYARFTEIMCRITGWTCLQMRHANAFKGQLNYTERELRKIKDLTEANGDVLFIDAVKHVYYGHLDYLLADSDEQPSGNELIQ